MDYTNFAKYIIDVNFETDDMYLCYNKKARYNITVGMLQDGTKIFLPYQWDKAEYELTYGDTWD